MDSKVVAILTIVYVAIVLGYCEDHLEFPKYPIILIPGDGGSQAYCIPKGNSQGFLVWVNLRYFLTPGSLAEYFSIKYNPETGEIGDSDLCEVVFPGWGDTWSIENLDTSKHSGTVYFESLIAALRQDPFFVSNETIRGAPFDFRRAPNENSAFMVRLRWLVEETYVNAGNKPVVLLGHSLGSLYTLAFLATVSDTWKQKYIKAFLSVSGPLGGSVKALKIEASGDNFGIYIRSPVSFRPVQRSLPSTAFLLPDPRLWPPSEPLIITPNVNYSAHDYEEFFRDINFAVAGMPEYWPTTYHMIYSEPTFYRSGFPDQYPTLVPGNGDGTVHMRSLELCRFWTGAKHIVLEGAEHLQIVGDPRLIDLVRQIIGARPLD
ncbi:hypothetical protein AHF37_07282 [Paragonimus kellicotti]|nr:hypothetical protein AHF37_07282 [Paragonimus kellicotti]